MGNCAPDDVHKQFPMLSSTQHYELKEYCRKRKKLLLFIGLLLFTVHIKQKRVVRVSKSLPFRTPPFFSTNYSKKVYLYFGFVFKIRTFFFFLFVLGIKKSFVWLYSLLLQ